MGKCKRASPYKPRNKGLEGDIRSRFIWWPGLSVGPCPVPPFARTSKGNRMRYADANGDALRSSRGRPGRLPHKEPPSD